MGTLINKHLLSLLFDCNGSLAYSWSPLLPGEAAVRGPLPGSKKWPRDPTKKKKPVLDPCTSCLGDDTAQRVTGALLPAASIEVK
jgi:hypothetical protein